MHFATLVLHLKFKPLSSMLNRKIPIEEYKKLYETSGINFVLYSSYGIVRSRKAQNFMVFRVVRYLFPLITKHPAHVSG